MIRAGDHAGVAAGRLMALGVLAVSCSAPTLSLSGYEMPLYEFQGVYNPPPIDPLVSARARVGIVWIDPWQIEDDVPASPQTAVFRPTETGFTLGFYGPPPDLVIHTFEDPDTHVPVTRFAFGEIVFYDDADSNGTFAIGSRIQNLEIVAPDLYWGAASRIVVRYLVTPLPAHTTLLPSLSGMLVGEPGFRLGLITCPASGEPYASIPDSNWVVTMQVDKTGSKTLPFARSCLRTHPVDSLPPPPAAGGGGLIAPAVEPTVRALAAAPALRHP